MREEFTCSVEDVMDLTMSALHLLMVDIEGSLGEVEGSYIGAEQRKSQSYLESRKLAL
jgi:hypothetical protein